MVQINNKSAQVVIELGQLSMLSYFQKGILSFVRNAMHGSDHGTPIMPEDMHYLCEVLEASLLNDNQLEQIERDRAELAVKEEQIRGLRAAEQRYYERLEDADERSERLARELEELRAENQRLRKAAKPAKQT